WPEDLLRLFKLSRVQFIGAPIQMTLLSQHHDPCGVDRLSIHAQQLAARRCGVFTVIECIHEFLDKRGRENRVGVEEQNILRWKTTREIIVRLTESCVDRRSR